MNTTLDDRPVRLRVEVDADADPTVHMEPRLRARRIEIRKAARRNRRRIVVSAASVVVLIGLAVGALYSPLLQLRAVTVLGDRHLTASEIVDSSGLRIGDRLIDVDSTAAARRVGRLPWVRTVHVTRHWPDSVTIAVVERAAVATVATASGGRLVIATGGRIAGLEGVFDQQLPPVNLPSNVKVRIGTVLPGPIADATEMLGAMPEDVLIHASGATISSAGDLTLILRPAGELWFGDAHQARQKFLSAETLLGGSVALDHLKRLDVRIPSACRVGECRVREVRP
jgi:cell division protein FtsQ